MKKRTSMALAAALLLAGASAASAATMQSSGANASPHDTLSPSSTQQQTAWKDLYVGLLNQATPSGFHAVVGTVVPNGVATAPMTGKAASDVPALKPYKFAMLQKKLLIINPTDKKIAEVITR